MLSCIETNVLCDTMCKAKVFLLNIFIVLYAADAIQNVISIFGPNERNLTNSVYEYMKEEYSVDLFCKFQYVRSEYKLLWYEDGKEIENYINMNKSTMKYITSNYTVQLNTGQNITKVYCMAKENRQGKPADVGAYVDFLKHLEVSNTDEYYTIREKTQKSMKDENRKHEWSYRGFVIICAAVSVAVLTTLIIIIIIIITCCGKMKTEDRPIKPDTNATYVNFNSLTPGAVEVPAIYATPVDGGMKAQGLVERSETYADPFVETNIEMLYSVAMPKSKRNMKTTVEETIYDSLSYDYIVHSKAGSYSNVRSGKGNSYVNDYSECSGKDYCNATNIANI